MTLEPDAWPASSDDGRARTEALRAEQPVAATSLIEYRSAGHLLIIGDLEQVERLRPSLGNDITVYALIPRASTGPTAAVAEPRCMMANADAVSGHLGAFTVTIEGPDGALNLAPLLRGARQQTFDLVLDLQSPPALRQDIPPAGYYAPGDDPGRLETALDELNELHGEFEKPKYFDYDPNICAHGRNGKYACRRCIDACPAQAITSAAEWIEVDPYLCQGGGSCATACPSGAITYAYPHASETLSYLRLLLNGYFDAGGSHPSVLFYDREHGLTLLTEAAAQLPEHVLAVAVEEIGSVGLDCWLATLAFGAADVTLLAPGGTAPSVVAELRQQLRFCDAILDGLALEPQRVRLLQAGGAAELGEAFAAPRRETLCRASFETFNEKRNTIFSALERLARAGQPPAAVIELPQTAPFGEVMVDARGCTLCLACASACPASALQGGSDSPLLRFIEANCVQCGLCVSTCPEQVITISPRLLLDAEARRTARTLHEEQPFLCLECGKPFATQKIIETMQRKLKDHWMFGDEAAVRRLKLCDECRIKDMFRREGGLRDVDKH